MGHFTCEEMCMCSLSHWILLFLHVIISMVATLLENRYCKNAAFFFFFYKRVPCSCFSLAFYKLVSFISDMHVLFVYLVYISHISFLLQHVLKVDILILAFSASFFFFFVMYLLGQQNLRLWKLYSF